ncbi:hypothetical protein BH10BDE1_BH10BDE1_27450 [soil metagenome]
MKCNVSKTGQASRLFVGMILIAWATAGGPTWTWVGLAIAATGAWRLCPLFMMFGIRANDAESPQAPVSPKE